jgi:hypothetical protein
MSCQGNAQYDNIQTLDKMSGYTKCLRQPQYPAQTVLPSGARYIAEETFARSPWKSFRRLS